MVLCASAVTNSSARAEPRAVLELFTSQGCSSCPAADKLIGEFASDPTLLAMSLAIDYWDYLGWKDTLALAGHSRRQKAYATARHDREVYTPQVVVNGIAHVLGSDKAAIERAIAQTQADRGSAVAAGDARDDGRQAQRQCPVRRRGARRGLALPDHQVDSGRDRRAAKITAAPITYHNVVRRWVKLGETGPARASPGTFRSPTSPATRTSTRSTPSWCSAAPPLAPA